MASLFEEKAVVAYYHCLSVFGLSSTFFTSLVVCSGLTSLSTIFSHITTVSGCDKELNAHFYSTAH